MVRKFNCQATVTFGVNHKYTNVRTAPEVKCFNTESDVCIEGEQRADRQLA